MSYTDYLDLRTAVIEFARTADIADVMTRLVKNAELDMSRALRSREQITDASLTVASGSVALPTGFMEAVGLFLSSGAEYRALPVASYQKLTSKTGYYTVSGTSLYASDGDYTLKYYASIPTITANLTDTNWLLAKNPDLYFAAVAFEAAKYIQNGELIGAAVQLRDHAYRQATVQDSRERYARARVNLGSLSA